MKEAKTHITIILDRTGSMEAIRSDTIGGFNSFLKQQQQEPGDVTMTLVQFDAQNPYEIIHDCRPIREVPELDEKTYVPRAATPLFDAMGRGINHLQQTLDSMPEGDLPEKVVLVVITDGQENSSREFNKKQVTAMINEKQEKAGWKFVSLQWKMPWPAGLLPHHRFCSIKMPPESALFGTRSRKASAVSGLVLPFSVGGFLCFVGCGRLCGTTEKPYQERVRYAHRLRRPLTMLFSCSASQLSAAKQPFAKGHIHYRRVN